MVPGNLNKTSGEPRRITNLAFSMTLESVVVGSYGKAFICRYCKVFFIQKLFTLIGQVFLSVSKKKEQVAV